MRSRSHQGNSTVYALADHHAIYVSQGGAGNWHTVSNGLPSNIGVYAVGLDSVSKDVLYAGTTGAGIYKTFNGGSHWFSANDESIATTYVYAMAVNPTTIPSSTRAVMTPSTVASTVA